MYKVKSYHGEETIPTVVYFKSKEEAELFIEVNKHTSHKFVLEKC